MHISSPSSKKSATRPARSSDWLRLSAVPSTLTLRQKSSRRLRIRSIALLQPVLGPLHAAVLPHDVAELAVVGVDAAGAVVGHEVVDARLHRLLASTTAGWSVGDLLERPVGEVVADRVRQHEVAVGQALHQRGGAEPVGAVVGEVRLAGHTGSLVSLLKSDPIALRCRIRRKHRDLRANHIQGSFALIGRQDKVRNRHDPCLQTGSMILRAAPIRHKPWFAATS